MGSGCSPQDAPLAEPPSWLLDEIAKKQTAPGERRPPEFWDELIEQGFVNGTRNNSFTSIAGHLIGCGVDPQFAWYAIRCINLCAPEPEGRGRIRGNSSSRHGPRNQKAGFVMSIKDNIIKLRLPPGGDPEAAGRAARAARPVPRYDEWIDRDIPPPDLLCGTWLSTTSRVLITGPTGLGKTMLAVALAMATASGGNFLHWDAGRVARILYVDGEMSRREMRRRLCDEGTRSGLEPENLFVLSKEDFDEMPPLNTEAGPGMDGREDRRDQTRSHHLRQYPIASRW